MLNLSVRLLDATKCFILKQASYAYHRHVRVTLHDESFEGVTRVMEPDGTLRVETPEGVMKIVRAGDVTALRATNVGDADR